MERKIVLTSLFVFLAACSQNGFQQPLASLKNEPATTTYSPKEPMYRVVNKKKVVDGLSEPKNFKFDLDGPSAKASLKGTLVLSPAGETPITVPIDVDGVLNKETGEGVLPAKNADVMKSLGVSGGASMTCIDEACKELFIDVYVQRNEYIYHHQLQVSGKDLNLDSSGVNQDSSGDPDDSARPPIKPTATPAPKKPKAPLGQVSGPDDDGSQFEHDIIDDTEAGTYVGNPERDIEAIFPDLSTSKDSDSDKNAKDKKDGKDENKDSKDDKKDSSKKDTKSGAMNTVKAVLKGLGQAVTGVGRNNFTRGRLENAANVYEYQQQHKKVGFEIIYPGRKNYYSTDDMKNVVIAMGQFNQKYMNGYAVSIGDLSSQKGGQLGRHASHQMGLDADIAYYFDDRSIQKGLVDAVGAKKPIRSFMAEEQWALFKAMVAQGNVDRIFIHAVLKKELCNIATRTGELKSGEHDSLAFNVMRVLRPEPNHDDHFHLRLKCSTAQPRCRQMAPPAKASGC